MPDPIKMPKFYDILNLKNSIIGTILEIKSFKVSLHPDEICFVSSDYVFEINSWLFYV